MLAIRHNFASVSVLIDFPISEWLKFAIYFEHIIGDMPWVKSFALWRLCTYGPTRHQVTVTMWSWYDIHIIFTERICYLPSSPPCTEKSRCNIDHFWMYWACEVAELLTLLIADWIASRRIASFCTSVTVWAELPWLRHHSSATGDSLSSGCWVSSSTSVWKIRI